MMATNSIPRCRGAGPSTGARHGSGPRDRRAPDHLGDDRLARRGRPPTVCRALRPQRCAKLAESRDGHRRPHRGPGEIHRPARLRPGLIPDRFYQMGMAEQVMISAAAGLAREGFVPFATTYAVFASRRAYDFICMAIAEENLPVKIVCALPGLTTGYGPSHQATEDLAILRGMPNLTVIDPCDATEIAQAVPAIAAHPGPVYMRLLRGKVPDVLSPYGYRFELGKAKRLRERRRCALRLQRLHDHARPGCGGAAGRRGRFLRRAALADHQAAGRSRRRRGGPTGRQAGRHGGKPLRSSAAWARRSPPA